MSGALALLTGLAACAPIRFTDAPGRRFEATEMVDVLEPDRVPALDAPAFDAAPEAARRLGRAEPVVVLAGGVQPRAYPLRILLWHEVVNDVVAERPVAVTYSPLSDSAAAFDRRAGGRTLTFGSSGKLYRASLVLYDRETLSLWPQLLSTAVAGRLEGQTLERVPLILTSLGAFADAAPQGRVLSDRTGFTRQYRLTPYPRYERRPRPSASFFLRPLDRRLGPMRRVAGVAEGGRVVAYPYEAVAAAGVLNDGAVAVVWQPQVRSVLDEGEIDRARLAGAAAVFLRAVDGRALTLRAGAGGGLVDDETGTRWDSLGRATAGPLAGRSLTPAEATTAFWFAWAAFNPSTLVAGTG